mgnify:CR=1 FL=1
MNGLENNNEPIQEGPKDPVLLELLPEFIEAWESDFAVQWIDIVSRGNLEELHRFGHTIKGSFLQFGFRSLSACGRAIMEAANAGDWNAATAQVKQLTAALETMKNNLSSSNNSKA